MGSQIRFWSNVNKLKTIIFCKILLPEVMRIHLAITVTHFFKPKTNLIGILQEGKLTSPSLKTLIIWSLYFLSPFISRILFFRLSNTIFVFISQVSLIKTWLKIVQLDDATRSFNLLYYKSLAFFILLIELKVSFLLFILNLIFRYLHHVHWNRTFCLLVNRVRIIREVAGFTISCDSIEDKI